MTCLYLLSPKATVGNADEMEKVDPVGIAVWFDCTKGWIEKGNRDRLVLRLHFRTKKQASALFIGHPGSFHTDLLRFFRA